MLCCPPLLSNSWRQAILPGPLKSAGIAGVTSPCSQTHSFPSPSWSLGVNKGVLAAVFLGIVLLSITLSPKTKKCIALDQNYTNEL